jgi:hypothetical protein
MYVHVVYGLSRCTHCMDDLSQTVVLIRNTVTEAVHPWTKWYTMRKSYCYNNFIFTEYKCIRNVNSIISLPLLFKLSIYHQPHTNYYNYTCRFDTITHHSTIILQYIAQHDIICCSSIPVYHILIIILRQSDSWSNINYCITTKLHLEHRHIPTHRKRLSSTHLMLHLTITITSHNHYYISQSILHLAITITSHTHYYISYDW